MNRTFAGLATGIGSWPGTDPRAAAAITVGEVALPYLPELPARGLGADMVGRASAILADLHFDSTVRGYRLGARRGATARTARDLLRADLDALEEAWETAGLKGSGNVKLQAAGPLTLAAEVELANGHRALTDSGAVRDIAASLAEGLRQHHSEVARRLGAAVVVQLDEPALPAVLAGTLSGVTGLAGVAALPAPNALALLDTALTGAGAATLVHCCAANVPWELLRRSTASAVSVDTRTLTPAQFDSVGELLDAGKELVLGLVPATAPQHPVTWRELAASAATLAGRVGLPPADLPGRVGVSPACGLAGANGDWARSALRLTSDVTKALADVAHSRT